MIPMRPVLIRQPKTWALEVVFAKNQPEYLPLPAFVASEHGAVMTRWQLTWRERLRVLIQGYIYLQQLTFGEALQPQLPSVLEPHICEDVDGRLERLNRAGEQRKSRRSS